MKNQHCTRYNVTWAGDDTCWACDTPEHVQPDDITPMSIKRSYGSPSWSAGQEPAPPGLQAAEIGDAA